MFDEHLDGAVSRWFSALANDFWFCIISADGCVRPTFETPLRLIRVGHLRSAEGFSNVSSSRSITHRVALAAVLILATGLVSGSSCVKRILHRGGTPSPEVGVKPLPPKPTGPTAPKIDYASIRPNELGRIPVIMYHEIRTTPGKRPGDLVRTVADFQADLQALYDAGYRPVNLSDVIEDKIDVPAGKSPVVLTFDDARATQFKLIETPQAMQIDPNSAMGVMNAFHNAHKVDWPMRATFFVLPKSKATMEPFGQIGMGNDKLDFIVKNGMEIGNHTTLHRNMRDMSPDQIQQEIGNANNELTAAVPGLAIKTMAVPMGKFPHNKAYWKYLVEGSYEGKPYHYEAAMDAAWRPMPSPDDKTFNPQRLERIDGTAASPYGVRDWIKRLQNHDLGMTPYISDGDPNVISFPQGEASSANLAKIKSEGKLAHPYSPFGGLGGTKPIVGADATATSATPEAITPASGPKPIVGADNPAPTAAGGADAPPAPTAPADSAPPAAPAVKKPISGN